MTLAARAPRGRSVHTTQCGVQRADADYRRERPEVFLVAATGGEGFHGEHMLRRGRHDPDPLMVEDLPAAHIFLGRHICTGLLVQPPRRKVGLLSDVAGLFEDHSVRNAGGIHIAGHPIRVIGECHGSAANDEEVGYHASPGETLSEHCERVLEFCTS
nr:hypothetical protein [Actinoplanes consettensis]